MCGPFCPDIVEMTVAGLDRVRDCAGQGERQEKPARTEELPLPTMLGEVLAVGGPKMLGARGIRAFFGHQPMLSTDNRTPPGRAIDHRSNAPYM